MTYYHGGIAGLKVGDQVEPAPPHVVDGCPICVARAEGRSVTVGEYRRWAIAQGPAGAKVLADLEGADPSIAIDPPSSRTDRIYITSSIDYATWYAARSRGDLYEVRPVGRPEPSPEDHFPSWTAKGAVVIKVVQRRVRLTRRDRRRIGRLWKKADAARNQEEEDLL